jgi:hypothetical protein
MWPAPQRWWVSGPTKQAALLFPLMRTIIQASSTMHSFRGPYLQLTFQTHSSTRRLLSPTTRQFTSRCVGSVRLSACEDRTRTSTRNVAQLRWKSTNNNNKGEAGTGNEQPPPVPKNLVALTARPSQQKQESTGYDHYDYGGGAPADTMVNPPYNNGFESTSLPVSNPRMVSSYAFRLMHVRNITRRNLTNLRLSLDGKRL